MNEDDGYINYHSDYDGSGVMIIMVIMLVMRLISIVLVTDTSYD